MLAFLKESFGSFQKPNCLNSQFQTISSGKMAITQSWITIKNATLDISKKIQVLSNCLPKWINGIISNVQLQKKKIVSCFDIGEVFKSPGKWNWNWLRFLRFIFSFEQCEAILLVNYLLSKILFTGNFCSGIWPISGPKKLCQKRGSKIWLDGSRLTYALI